VRALISGAGYWPKGMASDIDHGPPTRVVLRPLGSSLPLGLGALAVASLLGSGYSLGWVASGEAHTVGLLLLVTVVPAQAVTCVFALLSRDGAVGGAMGLQAITWAAFAAAMLSSPPGSTTGAVGLLLVAAGAVIALSATTMARAKLIPALAIGLSGVHFVAMGVYELAAAGGWQNVSGVVALAVVALAGYAAWAAELEDMTDTTVAPTGRLNRGRAAISAPFADQVAGLANEPGVRRQL
jgi:hypothetical protein